MSRRFWRTGLLASLLVASLVAGAMPVAGQERAGAPRYAPRPLLEGLLFGQGEVAERLGATVELPEERREEVLANIDRTLSELLDAYGPELEEVAAGLQSGDVHRVDRALVTLGEVIRSYLEAKDAEAPDPELVAACGFAVFCVFYFVLAVHNTVALTVHAAAAIDVVVLIAFWLWVEVGLTGVDPAQLPDITRDQAIAEVTKALAF